MFPEDFFDRLWVDYTSMAPQALAIHRMLEERGERVVNDHVAFRTIDMDPISLATIQTNLFKIGYSRASHYTFEDKHLRAWSYIHKDPSQPKVFLSAFDPNFMSQKALEIVSRKMDEIDQSLVFHPDIFWSGSLWSPITYDEHLLLESESDYLAWVMTHGIRPNHFTVSINHLETIQTVEQMLGLVEGMGIQINSSGGRVKGNPSLLLEQGSTMADRMNITFGCGTVRRIPTCYYEFARRYRDSNDEFYQGFVTSSADKIFESTDSNNGL